MKRREIIKLAARATGAALSLPLMTSLLSGCQSEVVQKGMDFEPLFFSKQELAGVKDLIDIILPKTDSPSASEVGVHKIIDSMVGKVYKAEDQTSYKTGFDSLINYLDNASDDKGFQNLAAAKKLTLLQILDTNKDEKLSEVKEAYLNLKQQTIAYYLSTEEVATKFLNYLPVPGKYEPCISLEEVGGKAWAI